MDAKEIILEAQRLFVEDKLADAAEGFTKAMQAGADPYMCHLSRGAAYLKLKDNEKAMADFDAAIALNEKSERAYYYRGTLKMLKDDHEGAVADFTKALEIKPALATARFARATSLARLERFDEATKDMRMVIPEMEANVQGFVDTHGIVRTEMWKVMAQLSGERGIPAMELTEKEIETLEKWVSEKE